MSKRSLIEAIEIKSPCTEDWEQMTGGERVRFCSHCALEVNNLSALTRKQATRLVRESAGRLCVRYVVNPVDRTPVFADRLYRITRRAAAAAGVLGATLAVSTLAYAQGAPVLSRAKTEIARTDRALMEKSESPLTSVSGTVTDQNGAVVPNARVTLAGFDAREARATVSDAEGVYKFGNVAEGRYRLTFEFEPGGGFKTAVREIEAARGADTVADVTLELTEILVTVGEIAVLEYQSPLFTAVFRGESDEVVNLIARGAAVNERDENFGRITPLFLAVETGSAEIAETLLNFGAQINARDDLRQTPLMRLDEDASIELVSLLIKHGARVNLTDRAGNTPLMLAARSVEPEVLRILIGHAKNLNARNADGRTALMEAADADQLENVRALLLAGADVKLRDAEGETAFALTTDAAIKELLTEFGGAE